jgi:tryptophan 2,3-dioxygenase
MAPTDFLDFRSFLSTASGFQSLQFRIFENKLGLNEVKIKLIKIEMFYLKILKKKNMRIKYNQKPYDSEFNEEQKLMIQITDKSPSLLKLIEAWLERTPCLVTHEYDANCTRNEINFFLQKFKYGFELYVNDTYIQPIQVKFCLNRLLKRLI